MSLGTFFKEQAGVWQHEQWEHEQRQHEQWEQAGALVAARGSVASAAAAASGSV